MTDYTLLDRSRRLAVGDDINGLKLTALFHVGKGDRITWEPRSETVLGRRKVLEEGFVNGKPRLYIAEEL
jgi:hypothetical protein